MTKNFPVHSVIEGCRKGQQSSQLMLYEHFFGYAMGVCLRYSKNREEALEITNDGFFKAFTKIDQFDSKQPFKPWLRRILINVSIDYYRKYHRLNDSNGLENIKLTPTATYNEALDNLEFNDLLKITQRLPAAYRMVFNLYVIENYTHQEIADQLEISVGTSKSNLSKARQKIKSMLGVSHGIYLKPETNGG